MGPIEFAVGWQRSVRRTFAAHPSAKYEADDETHEAKYEHKHTQVPVIISINTFYYYDLL